MGGAIIGNKCEDNLRDRIRSFAADYSRRLNLDKVAEQKYQALVVRASLKESNVRRRIWPQNYEPRNLDMQSIGIS